MTTGQEGSLSTGHANTPRDMLRRLETMILMTGYDLPLRAIREQIASAVDVIVHTARLRDGSRKIVSITEVLGTEDDDILTQEIFSFVQTAYRDGRVEGELRPTGVRPTFMGIFPSRGIPLPPGEFGIPPADSASPDARNGKSRWGWGVCRTMRGGRPGRGPGPGRHGRRHGLRVVRGTRRSRDRAGRERRHPRAGAPVPGQPSRPPGGGRQRPRQGRVGQLGAARHRGVRRLLRGVAALAFPGDAPVGQETLLPLSHRRAGFRVSTRRHRLAVGRHQGGRPREPMRCRWACRIDRSKSSRSSRAWARKWALASVPCITAAAPAERRDPSNRVDGRTPILIVRQEDP